MKTFSQYITEAADDLHGSVWDHRSDGTSMRIQKRPGGKYYGDNGKFDFERGSKEETHAQLKKWGYTNRVGSTHKFG